MTVGPLETDADGRLMDPFARSLATFVLRAVRYASCSIPNLERLAAERRVGARLAKEERERLIAERLVPVQGAMGSVLEHLVAAGRVEVKYRQVRFRKSDDFAREVEKGVAPFAANARINGARFEGVADVGRATAFYAGVRTIFGMHSVPLEGGGLAVVPYDVDVEDGTIVARRARAVRVLGERIEIVEFDRGTIDVRVRIEDGVPTVSVSILGEPRILDASSEVLHGFPVAAFSQRNLGMMRALPEIREASRACLRVRRDVFERWLGVAVPDQAWKGYSTSLRTRHLRKEAVLQRIVMKYLDPEARRAAMRFLSSDLVSYQWFRDPDRGAWRRQASATWPILTGFLKQVEDAIDGGRSILVPLSEATGIPVHRLVEMRGMTWNRAGYEFADELHKAGSPTSVALRVLPREISLQQVAACDDPSPDGLRGSFRRDRYRVLRHLGRFAGENLHGPFPGLDALLRRDLPSAIALVDDGDVRDSLRHVSEVVRLATGSAPEGCRRLVTTHVLGPDGGAKRVRRFSETYHRRLALFDSLIEARAIEIHGKQGFSYPVWTPTPGPVEGPSGTIRWLTGQDQLAAEGREMSHCVGSYFGSVVRGQSVIGKVVGRDGSRATVEIALQSHPSFGDAPPRLSLVVVQLRSSGNGEPSQACKETVGSFVLDVVEGRVRPDLQALADVQKQRRNLDVASPTSAVGQEDPEFLLEAARPLLPPSLASLDLETIRVLAEREALWLDEHGFPDPDPDEVAVNVVDGPMLLA